MIRLDYKDTDKKIEIDVYGLIFEIKKEIEEVDTNDIDENKNLNSIIDKILGSGAVDKINEQRKKDGHEELDTKSSLIIITACVNTYVEATTKPIDRTVKNYNSKYRKYNKYRRH